MIDYFLPVEGHWPAVFKRHIAVEKRFQGQSSLIANHRLFPIARPSSVSLLHLVMDSFGTG